MINPALYRKNVTTADAIFSGASLPDRFLAQALMELLGEKGLDIVLKRLMPKDGAKDAAISTYKDIPLFQYAGLSVEQLQKVFNLSLDEVIEVRTALGSDLATEPVLVDYQTKQAEDAKEAKKKAKINSKAEVKAEEPVADISPAETVISPEVSVKAEGVTKAEKSNTKSW